MTPKKFWFLSAPLYSHTDWGGFLKTAKVLRRMGHEVLWISEESLESAIRYHDLPFRAIWETGFLWPLPPQPDLTQILPQEAMTIRYRRALDTWLSEELVAAATKAILDLADEIGAPDLMAIDPFLSAAALAAEKLDAPMVVCGWPAQEHLDEAALFPIQRELGRESRGRIQRLCELFGLEGVNFSGGSTPSIISPHLHISYFTREWYLAEEQTLLPQNEFVGGKPEIPDSPPPQWLRDIPKEQAFGVITLGTTFTGDPGFFSRAAHALAREGVLPVVVIGLNPLAAEEKEALIKALPRGARLLNWVPFGHVLPRAKIMIHHGGMGTTHAAVVHGMPQIVVPHAADQRIQARRVAQARVGLNLSAHDVRQGKLWEGTKALLEADWVRENARKLAGEMAALGGPERAAEWMLAMLR